MVVALASDEGVWRAVLANKKIQEYRVGNAEGIKFTQSSVEFLVDVAQCVNLDFYVLQSAYTWGTFSWILQHAGDFEVGINSVAVHGRMTMSFLFLSHNAVRELKEVLWDQMRGIIDVVEKRLQAETRRVMLDAMIRAFMMMTVYMLTLIALLCLLPLQVSLDTRHW